MKKNIIFFLLFFIPHQSQCESNWKDLAASCLKDALHYSNAALSWAHSNWREIGYISFIGYGIYTIKQLKKEVKTGNEKWQDVQIKLTSLQNQLNAQEKNAEDFRKELSGWLKRELNALDSNFSNQTSELKDLTANHTTTLNSLIEKLNAQSQSFQTQNGDSNATKNTSPKKDLASFGQGNNALKSTTEPITPTNNSTQALLFPRVFSFANRKNSNTLSRICETLK